MERKSLSDAVSSHAAKPKPVAEVGEGSSKKVRNIALLAILAGLLTAVAWMYWPEKKATPQDIGPNATDTPPPPTPARPKPPAPGEPEPPKPNTPQPVPG